MNIDSLLYGMAGLVAAALIFLLTFFASLWLWGIWNDEWSGYNASVAIGDGVCNIAIVPIMGDITIFDYPIDEEFASPYTTADAVTARIRQAEQDPSILGVLVRIDSSGGYPVASEIIENSIRNSMLPSVGLIRETAASGGYLVATGADTIIASPFSDVGGIGITMSYVGNWSQNEKDGLEYVPLASAPYKDYLDPNKPLTDEERSLLERDLKMWHEQFVQEVADNRGLSVEDVARIADGSSIPGKLALENKLIDSLGDQETARQWFADQFMLSAEEVIFCE